MRRKHNAFSLPSGRIGVLLVTVACLLVLAAPRAWCVTLYSVRPRDTVAGIARNNGISSERLILANPELRNAHNLKIGQILVIPDRESGVTQDEEDGAHHKSVVINLPPPTPLGAPPVAVKPPILASGDVDFENIAVVSEQKTREELMKMASGHEQRPELASRRGMLLNQITMVARRFIGVPYVWGGTSSHGFDCSGFTMMVYHLVGIPLKRLADEQYYQGTPTKNPMPGDLVFFSTYLPGPSHVGIYLGNGYFIHASSSKGVTIGTLSDPYFKTRYLGARRFF